MHLNRQGNIYLIIYIRTESIGGFVPLAKVRKKLALMAFKSKKTGGNKIVS